MIQSQQLVRRNKMKWYKILAIVGALTRWMEESFADGKVNKEEALELISLIISAAGLDDKVIIKLD